MAKRPGDSTHRVSVKVKRRKGVKIRTVTVLDPDKEGPPPNVKVEYARLLKTRVTTSGKADSVTMHTLPLFEAKEVVHSGSQEPATPSYHEGIIVGDPIPATTAKKRQRKKMNDSVRLVSIDQSPYANDSLDEDVHIPGCTPNHR